MTIPNATRGLASSLVIIALILPEIAAEVGSPGDSAADNVSESISQQDNTIRVDPLDDFKKYRGGFNITNKHYWSVSLSASSFFFTGVYGYVIGFLWLLCGIMCGLFSVTINFCCQSDGRRRIKKFLLCNHNSCGIISPFPLAIMLMILAMVASVVVLVASAKFHTQARTSVSIIINTANDASEILHNATGALKEIQNDLVESSVGGEVSGNLDSTADKFDVAAEYLVNKAAKDRRIINKAIKLVFVITIVIIIFNLIAVTTLSVSGVLRFQRVLYLLVILCWLITVICWLLFGVYFSLENFFSDTCTTLFNFEENPYHNSLSSIIPCDELHSAKPFLSEVGSGTYNLVNEVNLNISNLHGTLFPKFEYICNPFSAPPEYLYQPENCPYNTIQIGDIPKVLKSYTCFDDNDENCGDEDFLSGSEHEVVESYTSSIQNLLNVYPRMENLLGCQLIEDAFAQVLLKHCKPLKKFARMVWLGIVFLAAIMVFLVVLWTVKAHHEHSYHPSDDSVQQHSGTENARELGADQEIGHN